MTSLVCVEIVYQKILVRTQNVWSSYPILTKNMICVRGVCYLLLFPMSVRFSQREKRALSLYRDSAPNLSRFSFSFVVLFGHTGTTRRLVLVLFCSMQERKHFASTIFQNKLLIYLRTFVTLGILLLTCVIKKR